MDKWNTDLRLNQQPFFDYLSQNGLKEGMHLDDDDSRVVEIHKINEKIELNSYRIRGNFYGFPRCCIDAYLPMTGVGKSFSEVNNLKKLIDEKKVTDAFLYSPPAFTPCSYRCSAAITMLTDYKKVLDRLDPEAAEELVNFNYSNLQ